MTIKVSKINLHSNMRLQLDFPYHTDIEEKANTRCCLEQDPCIWNNSFAKEVVGKIRIKFPNIKQPTVRKLEDKIRRLKPRPYLKQQLLMN